MKCIKKILIISFVMWLVTAILLIYNIPLITVQSSSSPSIGNVIELSRVQQNRTRSFSVDMKNKQFLMDGQPFRFVSGSFHYFRSLPETWQWKLRTMRAAGLNTVATYVEWSLHNPKDNIYNFQGIADLINFIQLAVEEDLYVILRPGPYICAEREFGGFPYWLLHKYPNIELRSYDENYLFEVKKWFQVLFPKIQSFLYGNGGPIILVQLENEYGFNEKISEKYKNWLRDEVANYVQNKAVLFTSDPPYIVEKGRIKNVLPTLNFGAVEDAEVDDNWKKVNGPLVNGEFYPGWLTKWQEKMERVETDKVVNTLDKMLRDGANVNFYVFFGGTNFGFTAGAGPVGAGKYTSSVTSYDYDAPMDESGCVTAKYHAIRLTIGKYFSLPNITIPECSRKIELQPLKMTPIGSLFEPKCKNLLKSFHVWSNRAKSFEALNQNSGFVLYETTLPKSNRDPTLLTVEKFGDRIQVYVDQKFIGILSRANAIHSIPINLGLGKRLKILVENEGRINFMVPKDFKGLLGNVKFGSTILSNWTMTGFPFESYDDIARLLKQQQINQKKSKTVTVDNGPVIFHATFNLIENEILDTFLDPTGWGKGFVFINGFNLGRYWPVAGPQITIYIPKELLKRGQNSLVILELQQIPPNQKIRFSNKPMLDGDGF